MNGRKLVAPLGAVEAAEADLAGRPERLPRAGSAPPILSRLEQLADDADLDATELRDWLRRQLEQGAS